jgi:hypothetical protein
MKSTIKEKLLDFCRGAGSIFAGAVGIDILPPPDIPKPQSVEEAFEQDAKMLRQDAERAMGRR